MDLVLTFLIRYEYLAMFGILVLCGVGLPLPEEVTLLGSGLLVGWQEADFWLASLTCSLGILAGDSIIFGMGHQFGQRFLLSRPMHALLTPARQARVQHFFVAHGAKALFLARFFPGVRIGVYAYAGSQGVPWLRFLSLDGLGVIISGPTSILVGRWAALQFANDREQAIAKAAEQLHFLSNSIVFAVGTLGVLFVLGRMLWRRRSPPTNAG